MKHGNFERQIRNCAGIHALFTKKTSSFVSTRCFSLLKGQLENVTLKSSTAIARVTGSPVITAYSTNHFIFQIFQRVLLLKTGMEINVSSAHITIARPALLRDTLPLGSGFSVNSFTPVSKRFNRGPYKWCDHLYVTLVL